MKIGISVEMIDKLQKRWGDEKYDKLRRFGYDAVDLNISDTDKPIYNCTDEEFNRRLLKEKTLAEKAGVEINQIHGPWRWPARDFSEQDRAERMEKMKKSIYVASVFGCKNWVVHPIMPFGTEDIGSGNEQKTHDMNLEFMTELLDYAKSYDVTICLENMPMPKFSLGSPEQILNIVKEINDEHFKICLDSGHVSVYPNLSPGDEVRRLGNEIRVLHIHDNMFERDLHLMPYYGIIDWEDFSKALEDIGFDGVFSLESTVSDKLPDDVFEQMYISLARIAEVILRE